MPSIISEKDFLYDHKVYHLLDENRETLPLSEKVVWIASALLVSVTSSHLVSKIWPTTFQRIYRQGVSCAVGFCLGYLTLKKMLVYFLVHHPSRYCKQFILDVIKENAKAIRKIPYNESLYLEAIKVNPAVIQYIRNRAEVLNDEFLLKAYACNPNINHPRIAKLLERFPGGILKHSPQASEILFQALSTLHHFLYLDEILNMIVLNKKWHRKSNEWSLMRVPLSQPARSIYFVKFRENNFLDRAVNAKQKFDLNHPDVKKGQNEKLLSLNLDPYKWLFSSPSQINPKKYFQAFKGVEILNLTLHQTRIGFCLQHLKTLEKLQHLGLFVDRDEMIFGVRPEEYKSLGKLVNLTHLNISYFPEEALQYLASLGNLTSLDLKHSNTGPDSVTGPELRCLEKLPLKHLFLDGNQFLRFIPALSHLETLSLKNCINFMDDAGENFSKLEKLTGIDLTRTQTSDITLERLSKLNNLTSIKISNLPRSPWNHNLLFVTNQGIKHLSTLSSLTKLDASKCGELTQLALEQLTDLSLTFLNLSSIGVTRETNFKAVFQPNNALTRSLTQLELSEWSIKDEDLAYFSQLKNLTYLDLSHTLIKGNGFYHLSSLLKLNKLLLRSPYLVEFAGISTLKHLHGLDLNNCSNLKELTGIEALIHLRGLNLMQTSVTENCLPALESLKNLRVVRFDTSFLNKVSDAMVTRLQAAIPELELEFENFFY